MDPSIILIIVNIALTAILPIVKCLTRTRRSKCCGGEVELDPAGKEVDEKTKINQSEQEV